MSEIYELAAYPTSHELYGGLTKRELFAAMALQGILARTEATKRGPCRDAVSLADALLAELAEEEK
jgi:hypothetical protein